MPIHYAAQNGNYKIVKILIEAGGYIDSLISFYFFLMIIFFS